MFSEPWLTTEEQELVCGRMLDSGLLKFSNRRDLPLKKGGTTDIYVAVRDARNDHSILEYLAAQYENPLRRLGVVQFAEVPDAVSCLAGPLSIRLKMPYVTIREQPKPGRVANATHIGTFAPQGSRVAIIDDVITDGASKIAPYWLCHRHGLDTVLTVLVDRQQGWPEMFRERQVDLPVWAGMTLHDVRRFLITQGYMQRCDPAIEEKNPLIVALDNKSWEEILPIIDPLRPAGCILKVNDLLFDRGIQWLVPNLQVYGRVMVDLKAHDIPNTVANICRRLREYQPWAVTVHASGGEEMIRAAVKALEGTSTQVFAVTVLTTMRDDCEEVYHRLPIEQVRVLAAIANKAGAHGFVCSPEEAPELRAVYPRSVLVTPGIRSEGVAKGDQKRVDTPAGAMAAGSSHPVMGRQILGADDPVAEVHRVLHSVGIVL